MDSKEEKFDLFPLSDEATRVLDLYARARQTYDRTMAAMGRVTKHKITMANTGTITIGHVSGKTS